MNFKYFTRFLFAFITTFLFLNNQLFAATENFLNGQTHLNVNNNLSASFNLSNDYQFNVVNRVVLPNGKIKVKLQQTYQNIPILGSQIAATQLKSGELTDVKGSYLSRIEKEIKTIKPKITEKAALQVALKKEGIASKESVENTQIKLLLIQNKNKKMNLIYQVSFVILGNNPKRPYFNIDAMTGAVLESWDGLATVDARGPGGNLKTGQYYYGSDYGPLVVNEFCQLDTPNIGTYDMQNETTGTGVLFQFTCPENTYKFTNGAYSPLNDVHYFGNLVFNMYHDWFNTVPITRKN